MMNIYIYIYIYFPARPPVTMLHEFSMDTGWVHIEVGK